MDSTTLIQLGSTTGPCKGSLAWAAALQTPSYVISDGEGKLTFHHKDFTLNTDESTFIVAGITYKIDMREFELERELGRGQFGIVLLVRHLLLDRLFALKDVRLEISAQSIKQVMTEIDVLTKAFSPYIIEFFGAFHNQASIYICLEHMDCGSLHRIARKVGVVPETVLSAVAFAVVMGMRFLYKELRMMHRDIKPSNILVNSKGEVKLCDFGISGYLVRSLAKTHVGSMCYMAPERVALETPAEYTAKADIWSLGVSLYETATNQPLYAAENYDSPFAQLMSLVNDPSPKLPETFSEEFRSFVDCCLQKDPNSRSSFDELLEHPWINRYYIGLEDYREVVSQWLSTLLPEINAN